MLGVGSVGVGNIVFLKGNWAKDYSQVAKDWRATEVSINQGHHAAHA